MSPTRRYVLSLTLAVAIVLASAPLWDHPLALPAALALAAFTYEAIWWGHVKPKQDTTTKGVPE